MANLFAVADAAALESRWYAAYTCANHEKRVAEQLATREIEFYLPLYDTVRKWKDRRVHLELPLFPGYVFVHIPLWKRLRVLEIPGVARFVGFNGRPAPLPDGEIEELRRRLAAGACAEPYRYLTRGHRVRIHSGPLEGLEGILIRQKQKFRIVVSVELIQRSVAVEVDMQDVEPISARKNSVRHARVSQTQLAAKRLAAGGRV